MWQTWCKYAEQKGQNMHWYAQTIEKYAQICIVNVYYFLHKSNKINKFKNKTCITKLHRSVWDLSISKYLTYKMFKFKKKKIYFLDTVPYELRQ